METRDFEDLMEQINELRKDTNCDIAEVLDIVKGYDDIKSAEIKLLWKEVKKAKRRSALSLAAVIGLSVSSVLALQKIGDEFSEHKSRLDDTEDAITDLNKKIDLNSDGTAEQIKHIDAQIEKLETVTSVLRLKMKNQSKTAEQEEEKE